MAERHFINGGVDNLWTTHGNWSLTEGGAGGQTDPTATEDVFFDVGSPNCTLNAGAKACKTLTTSAYTNTLTFDQTLSVSGDITIGANTKFAGATTNYLAMIVSGTWTTNGLTIPQDILIGGTAVFACTLADALTTTGNLLLNTLTSTTFSGDFHITAATCTITGTQAVTIVHDVTISGLTTFAAGANVLTGLFNWNTGGLTMTGTLTGTTTVVLTGGTWSGAGTISNSVTFAGDSIVSGTVGYAASGTPTITWTSGAITTTGSTLSIATACTLNTNGMSWNNIILSAALTLTINSLLTATGTLTLYKDDTTFAGTAGFTVGTFANTTLTSSVPAKIFTFASGKTYTITTAMNIKGISGYHFNLVASTPGTKVILTLGYGATQDVEFCHVTDMDSSLGQCIFSELGTITTSYNWSTALGHGRIIPDAGGESVTVAGITKDNAGTALGSCDVYLFRDNGNDTATYIAYVESNSVTGAYSFTVFPGSTYFVVAFKGGATPVMDVTDRTVTAV